MRFNADGSLDSSFDGDGVVRNTGFGVTLQPDGKYIVIGDTGGSITAFDLFRYNPDGSLDLTFGTNGRVLTSFPQFLASVNQVALKANGEIYAAGYAAGNSIVNPVFAIARYDVNGTLLAKTTTPWGNDSFASTLAFQSDGKLVVAGTIRPFETDVAVARYVNITNDTGAFKRSYDFNADGRDDIAVYRPGSGGGPSAWFSAPSTNGYVFGSAGDLIAPGDFTGDGVPDLGVFRPSTGYWYYSLNLVNPGAQYGAIKWGVAGDIPVAADYDSDGKADVAVFRPSQGAWYIRNSSNGSFRSVSWGAPGDIPVVGDYDGDSKPDLAVFRSSAGAWYILKTSDNQMLSYGFGANGDRPVQADYDGDGTTDIAVFRPSDGVWYSIRSSTGGFVGQAWGTNGDIPAPGDYDGDGKADLAVFRPTGADGYWYILRSDGGSVQTLQWGTSTDSPVPGN
jgi:uncharacterized delta-60 repeat protein